MARAGAWLFVAGGTLGLVSLVLPHAETTDEGGIAADALLAYAAAALVLVVFDRLPLWAFQLLTLLGSVLISLAVYFAGDDSSAYAFLYLWVGLYSSYFFPWPVATGQAVVAAASYAAVLAAQQPAGVPLDRFVIAVGTLVVTVGLVCVLRGQIERLIGTLSDAARTDALTGLRNRRAFQETLEIELERSRRSGQPVAVLVADLDRFKAVNDRLRHHGGDAALRRVATLLAESKRLIDTVARIGGEEFALIAPECDARHAYALAERMRTRLREAFLSTPVPLTLSVGVASYPDHGASPESLLRAADEALYAAKRLGRDRAVIFSDELADTLSLLEGGASASRLGMLLTLAEVLDVRDPGTLRHSQRVGQYAELAARELGLASEQVEQVRLAGILHDIGKIGIPNTILDKPGPLTTEEWEEIRRHPEIGARLVGGAELEDIRAWILAHHEQPDGNGYPAGLRAGAIPLEASILAVADAYEAMTADRRYRPAIGHASAQAELERCSGTQFDERVVAAFLRAIARARRRAGVLEDTAHSRP